MQLNMRKWLALIMACLLVTASACNNEGKQGAEPNKNEPKAAEMSAGKPDPKAKYDPPIVISTVRATDVTVKYKEGDSVDNNVWTRLYENELGIKIKNKWVVNAEQYDQKLNVTIAANDLPDIFNVNAVQFMQLADAGQLEDLTEIVENFLTPEAKEYIDRGPNARASSTVKGRLLALPPAEDYFGTDMLLYVRKDWLKKLDLPEPKTMDDVLNISRAFTTQDPDGNGKPDTYGLAASKEIMTGYPSLTGFMNGYHAYMDIWIKDASGMLVFGSIQPEMKTALAKLQELYKAGEIDKEFGVKDMGKSAELQVNGKVGMNFGAMWNPLYPLQDNVNKEPGADWGVYPIPSADGTPAKVQADINFNQYWVVKKGIKHPEAVAKLYNALIDKLLGKEEDRNTYVNDNGSDTIKYALLLGAGTAKGYISMRRDVIEALNTKDTSKLNSEGLGTYDKIVAFRGGDTNNWGTDKVFGVDSSWAIIDEYYDKMGLIQKNEFFGAPTLGMTENMTTLKKLVIDTFTKIILGAPLSDFDKFVENWKKLGGDQITKEVNDWYANK